MAKKHVDDLSREDFDAGPSSYDEIESNLFLGNLTAATDIKWLKEVKISHILTADSCPLPEKIHSLSDLTLKYIQVTDMPREDFLTHFEEACEFIKMALASGGRVLVHCYFGVSRSATLVIAYLMKTHGMTLEMAFEAVKVKRRFVGPNAGFMAQLKLYEEMGCVVDSQNIQYKIYRLQIAADKVRKAKILPSNYSDLIKPDPALISVRPEPTVYRCKKCRRIVAGVSNILPHTPQEYQIWRHVSIKRTDDLSRPRKKTLPEILNAHKNVATSSEQCTKTYFVEPMAWMPGIAHNSEGKLNCPKCSAKLGSFSWVSGCQCPCGTKMAPAFYLVPSKVDWSNAVQNVLVTV